MRDRIIRLIVLLLLPVTLLASESDSRRLLVFGDSLSAAYGIDEASGWVILLEEKLVEADYAWKVINASVSGETTTGGVARLPAMLETYRPDIILLELGGNDGLRGLPLPTIRANLEQMITMAQTAGARVILAGIQIPPNYGPRYTIPFFQQYQEIAEQENVPLIPFLIDGIPQQPQLMQDDGIHPTAEAQPMIVHNVWPVLESLLNDQGLDD
ncbi:MAG: arylesterase [Pseudohongiellaceae bacterium]